MIKLLIKFNLFVNQNQKNLKVSNRKFMLASSKNKNCSDLSNDKSASKHHQINKKSIDLYSVSFKLQKPQSEQSKSNSKARNNGKPISTSFQAKQNQHQTYGAYRLQRQTDQKQISTSRNPFARANHLFKNCVSGKHSIVPIYQPTELSSYKQKRLKFQQQVNCNAQQTGFLHLENSTKIDSLPQQVTLFDSFAKSSQTVQQNQTFTDDQSLQLCANCNHIKNASPQRYESNKSKQIKIWQQYSVINDNFECPPSNIRTTNRRTERCVTTPAQNQNCKPFFFLTQNSVQNSSQNAQNQSAEIISNFQDSTIKEFCFNLDETEGSKQKDFQCSNQMSDLQYLKTKKNKIKKMVQEFLERIEQIPQEKLTNCLYQKIDQSLRRILKDNIFNQNKKAKKAFCQNRNCINNQTYNNSLTKKCSMKNNSNNQHCNNQHDINFNFQKSLRNNSSNSQIKVKRPQFGVGTKRDSSPINNSDRYLITTSKSKSHTKKQTSRYPGKWSNLSHIEKSPKTTRKLF